MIALLSVVSVLTILVPLLFWPVLRNSKVRGQAMICLNNNKELALAAHLYAADHRDLWIANRNRDPAVNVLNIPANYVPSVWAEGVFGFYDQKTTEALLSKRLSLIRPYLKSVATLKCTGDSKAELTTANGTFVRIRNYGMNCFFGWTWPAYHGEPNPAVKRFLTVGATSRPADFFLFGEIHPFSMCHPFFGVHPNNGLMPVPTACSYYHMPANFHGSLSVFSYADGHASVHAWKSAFFNNPGLTWDDGIWHTHDGPYPALSKDPEKITADT